MRLFLGVLVGDRLALDPHVGDGGAQRRHFHAVAEIDLGGMKVNALRSTLADVRVKGEPVANQNAKK